MNKKELTNLILILVVFTVLNFLLFNNAKNQKKEAPLETPETLMRTAVPNIKDQYQKIKEETAELDTPLVNVTFSNLGGRIKNLKLKKFLQADKKTPVELIPNPQEPTLNYWLKNQPDLINAPYQIKIDEKNFMATLTFSEHGTVITKKFHFSPDSYVIDHEISCQSSAPECYLSWGPGLDEKIVKSGSLSAENEAYIFSDAKLTRIKGKDFPAAMADWAGLGTKYFMVTILPQNFKGLVSLEKKEPGKSFLSFKFDSPKANQSIKMKIYAGPKNYDNLKSLGLGLEKTVDLGWKLFEPFSLGILFFLKSGHRIIGNYGILIIILTVLIKLVFHPLSIKSFDSSRKMQKLQPEVKKLQEKYKGQPEKLQKEMAELYKSEKINPLGGCLPVLIQIPIFFALFSTLSNSIELRGSGFFLWINDLSRPDTIAILAGMPINVLPILMGISMFFQQKLMPMPQDNPASQQMLYLMPVLMTVLFWGFPSGLVLYWLTNNVVSIYEQYNFFKSRKD